MAKYQFNYYLHDNYEGGEMEGFLTDPKFGNLPADVARDITEQRPFYEITLDCVYDTETGEVTIVSAT